MAYPSTGSWLSLSEKDQADLDTKKAVGKSKTFKQWVLYSDLLHSNLYKLATMVDITYQADNKARKYFDNLLKNKSKAIHKIGQWIVKNHTRVAIMDLSNVMSYLPQLL